MPQKILFIPPDTRPPTLELPIQLAQMTGTTIQAPPPEALPNFNQPGDTQQLKLWLQQQAANAEALIVCLETLCLGGMIPARREETALETVLHRLELLKEIKKSNPQLKIYAFGVVVRVAHDNDPHEEKSYYGEWGKALRAYSTAFDQHARHGQKYQQALDEAKAAIDPQILADWLSVRERNKSMHLAALDLLAEGVLTHLNVTLDDTSEYGLAAYDRREIEARADELQVWNRFDLYPGADEVPCALLVRALRLRQPPAKAWVRYSGCRGEQAGLIYEDRSAGELIKAQLRAAGCVLAENVAEADFILAVNTPAVQQANIQPNLATVDTPERYLPAFIDTIQRDLEASRQVSIADIAYPNGAERRFWQLLQPLPLSQLAGFSAWNTAGNTLGSAIAFGALAGLIQDKRTHYQALFARMVDDVLYQAFVRSKVRNALGQPSPFDLGKQRVEAEKILAKLITPVAQEVWNQHFKHTGFSLEWKQPAHLAWPRLFTGVFPINVNESKN